MRVLIVDDEPIARARLRRLLEKFDGAEVVGEAGDGREAIEAFDKLNADVVLLDINMPHVDGLSAAEHPSAPAVIFTTAHREHALDAFEADATDYLLKPVSKERLERALAKVQKALVDKTQQAEPWRLIVRDGSVKRFIDARLVDAFHADQKYLRFAFEGEEHLYRESLDKLEERLAKYGFLRVNRGALVRREAITAYDSADGGWVVLQGGERVAVSRRAAPQVREALGV